MRIAQIYMPKYANDKKSLNYIKLKLENDLIFYFGGCTQYSGYGSWNSGKKIFREPVIIFNVACNNTLKVKNIIINLAKKYKKLANQEAIFTVLPSGAVSII